MVDIMESLQEYVPTHSTLIKETVPGVVEEVDIMKDEFHQILFGGDQLTVARARGSQRIRKNSECGKERLEGLIPVCEDWHTKLCLLGVRCMINNNTHFSDTHTSNTVSCILMYALHVNIHYALKPVC